MLEITATIHVEEEVWKKAIADSWNEQYDDDFVTTDEITTFDNIEDFQRAVSFLPEDTIKSVHVRKE